jgi:ferredoxin
MTTAADRVDPVTLEVDMIRCQGHGICAWLLPDRIVLDPWGYPVVDPEPIIDTRGWKRAVRTVRACPQGALRLSPVAVAIPSAATLGG